MFQNVDLRLSVTAGLVRSLSIKAKTTPFTSVFTASAVLAHKSLQHVL